MKIVEEYADMKVHEALREKYGEIDVNIRELKTKNDLIEATDALINAQDALIEALHALIKAKDKLGNVQKALAEAESV